MRKKTLITASLISGLVATALVTAGGVAVAAGNQGPAPRSSVSATATPGCDHTTGMDHGKSMDHGNGKGMGSGMGSGSGASTLLPPASSGTLTDAQKATLLEGAEEEKMAHDLYVAFSKLYSNDEVFAHISGAETKHLEQIRALLDRYNLTDPTTTEAPGQFSSPTIQKLYDTLLAQGTASRDGAFEAAQTVEKTDITDLTAAIKATPPQDVVSVYEHLLTGSEHHLTAFGG